jgi:hypothetical protein
LQDRNNNFQNKNKSYKTFKIKANSFAIAGISGYKFTKNNFFAKNSCRKINYFLVLQQRLSSGNTEKTKHTLLYATVELPYNPGD